MITVLILPDDPGQMITMECMELLVRRSMLKLLKTKQNVYIYTAPGSKATSMTSHAAAIPGGQPTPQR